MQISKAELETLSLPPYEGKKRKTHFNSKMFNILGLFIFLNFTFTYPYPLIPKSDHKNGGYDGESTGIRMHVLFFSPICS